MEEIKQACSIVIVGGWNTRILTPPWLGKNIFKKDELEIRFPIDPALPMKVTDGKNYTIDISTTRLVFQPTVINEQKLALMSDGVINVLKILPHTPITAAGVNFGFKEINPDESLGNLFNNIHLTNIINIEKIDNLNELVITYKFILSNDFENRVLQLRISKKAESNEVILNFNFHKDISSADEARTILEPESVTKLHNYSLIFLQTMFNITEE